MTDLDLTKLREIAEAATDGPWNLHTLRTDETHDIRGSIDDEANIVIYAECEDADAHHIATFDPPTVLALIDEIERLQGVIEDVLAIHTGSNRSLYGNDFEAGMVKALWLVHKVLDGEVTHEQP